MSNVSKESSTVPESDKPKPLRILAAEDDIGVAALLEAAFSSRGHQIEVVDNAQDALTRLRAGEYDWLITDRGLKNENEDGFFLVKQMKDEGLGTKTFKTLLTGSAMLLRDLYPTDSELEKHTGIQELVGKPFRPLEFLKKVDQVRQWQEQAKLA